MTTDFAARMRMRRTGEEQCVGCKAFHKAEALSGRGECRICLGLRLQREDAEERERQERKRREVIEQFGGGKPLDEFSVSDLLVLGTAKGWLSQGQADSLSGASSADMTRLFRSIQHKKDEEEDKRIREGREATREYLASSGEARIARTRGVIGDAAQRVNEHHTDVVIHIPHKMLMRQYSTILSVMLGLDDYSPDLTSFQLPNGVIHLYVPAKGVSPPKGKPIYDPETQETGGNYNGGSGYGR